MAAAVSAGVAGADLPTAVAAAEDAAAAGAQRGHWVAGGDIAARLRWVRGWVRDLRPDRLVPALDEVVGTSVAANESVVAAFALVEALGSDVRAALTTAASLGGDTDTIAAICGAVLGAHHGVAGLPGRPARRGPAGQPAGSRHDRRRAARAPTHARARRIPLKEAAMATGTSTRITTPASREPALENPRHRTGAGGRAHGPPRQLFWVWFAANISILGLPLGATLVALGMTVWQAVIAAVLGAVGSFAVVGAISIAGRRGGAPGLTLSRAIFGVRGNIGPTLVSLLSRLGWETVNTTTAAFVLLSLSTILFGTSRRPRSTRC